MKQSKKNKQTKRNLNKTTQKLYTLLSYLHVNI